MAKQGNGTLTGVILTNTTVFQNTGAHYGGGIDANYGEHYITNCAFANNCCELEGGGIGGNGAVGISPPIYTNNTIVANNISTTTDVEDYDTSLGGKNV